MRSKPNQFSYFLKLLKNKLEIEKAIQMTNLPQIKFCHIWGYLFEHL